MTETCQSIPSVFGPLATIVKYCGLNFNYSLFRFSEAKHDGKLLQSIITSLMAIPFFVVIIYEFVMATKEEIQAFTLEWCESTIDMGLFLHGIGSIIFICIWTHSRFMKRLEERFRTIQNGNRNNCGSLVKNHVMCIVLGMIYVIVSIVICGRDLVYPRKRDGSVLYFSLKSVWDSSIIGRTLTALFSSICLSLYSLSILSTHRLIEQFSFDLQKSITEKDLKREDIVCELSERHCELMSYISFVHSFVEKFLTISVIGGVLALINSMVSAIGYKDKITVFYMVIMMIYFNCAIGIIIITLGLPGRTQEMLSEINQFLLSHKSIWCSQNEKVFLLCNSMIKRGDSDHFRMSLCGAFCVDKRLQHKVMFFVPLIANCMIVYIKYYL